MINGSHILVYLCFVFPGLVPLEHTSLLILHTYSLDSRLHKIFLNLKQKFGENHSWFDGLVCQFGVEELDGSAQSSDLDTIQHHWEELKHPLWARSYQPTSVLEFTNVVESKWEQLPAVKIKQIFTKKMLCVLLFKFFIRAHVNHKNIYISAVTSPSSEVNTCEIISEIKVITRLSALNSLRSPASVPSDLKVARLKPPPTRSWLRLAASVSAGSCSRWALPALRRRLQDRWSASGGTSTGLWPLGTRPMRARKQQGS